MTSKRKQNARVECMILHPYWNTAEITIAFTVDCLTSNTFEVSYFLWNHLFHFLDILILNRIFIFRLHIIYRKENYSMASGPFLFLFFLRQILPILNSFSVPMICSMSPAFLDSEAAYLRAYCLERSSFCKPVVHLCQWPCPSFSTSEKV